MVAARYIEERYLNPLRAKRIKREEEAKKKIREEARAKGLALAQAHAKTLALGHARVDAEWGAWNERRLAAEAKGEPFDEPTPATLRNRSLTMAQLRATGPYIWVTSKTPGCPGSCPGKVPASGPPGSRHSTRARPGPGCPRTSTRPAGSWTTPPC